MINITVKNCKNKMKYLVILWLWCVTISKQGENESNTQTNIQCNVTHDIITAHQVKFYCVDMNHNVTATCNASEGHIFNCSAVFTNYNYDDHHTTDKSEDDSTDSEGKISRTTNIRDCHYDVSEPNETSDGMITKSEANSQSGNISSTSTAVLALGILVCLLLLLLVTVTTAFLWICWLLKKRGGLKLSSHRQMRSNADHGQLVNPTYEGDDLLRLQPGPAPAYETISPYPRVEAKLEITEEGENGYHILKREERANPETTIRLETIFEASKEDSYSKLEFKEESSTNKKASQECITEYGNLETVTIKSSVPKDTDDATSDSNYDKSEGNEKEKSEVNGNVAFDDDGHQEESGYVEKGQENEAEIKLPVISVTLDAGKERDEPETSTTETD